jgi:RloB-like protein
MGGRRGKPRQVGTRGEPRKVILIVCEGEKTEPNYFKGFRLSSAMIFGLGKSTKSLVEDALTLKKEHQPDSCWCVFDRDSFPAEQVNGACSRAEAHGFRTAISNECFELWYLLHFDYIDAALPRSQYAGMLTTRMKRAYKKNADDVYELLLPRQADAIRNAKRLLGTYTPLNPADHNPFTTVHSLVEELNKHVAQQALDR